MIHKIEKMLKMQDEINTVVHSDWKHQGFDWCRAGWVECAELMDHYGWKWWKKQEPNIEQSKLELVDIWHFILSQFIADSKYDTSFISSFFSECKKSQGNAIGFLNNVEIMSSGFLSKDISKALYGFANSCYEIGLSFDELYSLYVSKNVLNKFRQDNGYKDGTYIKEWFGKEDNEYLIECIEVLDTDHEFFTESLLAMLEEGYQTVLETKG